MSEQDHVRELLDLARDSSLEARRTLVDLIGDLFAERESVLTERERALMIEILEKLLGDFETEVRQQLAQRLADSEVAPRALIDLLANDEIAVARPVLMHSQVLRDQELIRVVRHRSRQHQLAVAVRNDVSPPVADALVETGDDNVIKTLLDNPSARIAEATLSYLVDQARTVDTFQEPLVARTDLAPDMAQKLYWFVSAALRERILERFEIRPSQLDDALEAAAHELGGGTAAAGDRRSPAMELAARIAEERGIDAALLLRVLRQGEVPLFEALFGELSGIRPPRLQHVLYETGGKGLAVACRALEISRADFSPLYLLSRKGRGGETVVDPRELAAVMTFFSKVQPTAAREVLRSWQRDHAYQDAIDAIAGSPHVDAGRL
jgi:uncharacterized protein (DUF2336 family)